MVKSSRKKRTIGRRDMVDLPELDLENVVAKVDTGAYTSAVHVKSIRTSEKEGRKYVSFKVRHPSHPSLNNNRYEFPVLGEKKIRSSTGKMEKRFIIKTKLRIFGRRYSVEFSLADRSRMECPVLLGRKFLYRKFIVDVTQKNLSFRQKQKKDSDKA